MVKFRKEHIAVLAEQTAHHTKLARFLGRDEIASHIVRSGKRLVLVEAAVEAVKKRAIAERDICKSSGGNRHFHGTAVQEELHDTLARPHHVHGVRRLVGGHAEILLRAALLSHKHRAVGVEDVRVNHAHERVRVFLTADMLQGRCVENIVIPADTLFLLIDERTEDVAPAVERKSGELSISVAHTGADVAHQLHHVVLADVHHVQYFRVAGKKLAADCASDGARPADDEEARIADSFREERFIYGDVALKQGRGAPDEGENVVLHGIVP